MLAALKAKKDQAQAFVAEKKDEHETKKRSELLSKVEKDGEFKDFAGWQAEFEPVKPAGEKKGSEPNVVQRKAMEKLTANITADVLKGLTETVSKLLGPAAQVVRGQEPELGRFLNAANAVALTYRFGYKDMKRFAYVRTVSADRIAQALGAAIEKEQQRSGHKELDPAAVKQAVDAITARCLEVLRTKEAEAVEALKASPLFGVTGASGEQLDAGVVLLKDFLRGYVQDQIGQVIRLLAGVLERLLHLAAKYKDAIKKHAAENKDGFADGSPEMQKLRDEILGEIEKSYQQLHDAVSKYVGGLVGLMNASGGDDEAGDA